MTDTRPQRPPRPKHVPFWPVLIGFAFMIAIVISGLVASNKARSEHLTIVTSTLPPRHPKSTSSTTSTTAAGKGAGAAAAKSTVPQPTTVAPSAVVAAPGSDACTANNLVAAAVASGQVPQNVLGTVTAPQFKCVSGYALARLVPSKPNEQSVTADYQLQANKTWKMLNLGDVNPPDDGVPDSVASQLVLG